MIKRAGKDGCSDCILGTIREKEGKKLVKNLIETDAEICFHGLGPGKQEAEEGFPFLGSAGKKLKDAIKKAGYNPEDVSFTNSVLCQPPENKIDSSMTIPCLHHFKESIGLMPNLKLVVLCGNDSYKAVVGKSCTMKNVYLSPFQLEEFGDLDFVAIPHPASILYNPTAKAISYFYDGVSGAFGILQAKKKIVKKKRYVYITQPEQVPKALALLKSQKVLAVDTEATSLKFYNADMICFALSFEERTAIIFMWKWHKNQSLYEWWEDNEKKMIIDTFTEIFNDSGKGIIAHNSKYDSLISLKEFETPVNNIRFDTMLGSFLLDSNQSSSLEQCVIREIPENTAGYKGDFWSGISEREKEDGSWIYKKTKEEIMEYCASDCSNTFELAKIYIKRLKGDSNVQGK